MLQSLRLSDEQNLIKHLNGADSSTMLLQWIYSLKGTSISGQLQVPHKKVLEEEDTATTTRQL